MEWRNRIVGHGEEAPDQLLANPMNFRVHNDAQRLALRGVLKEVGFIQSVIVNRRTQHLIDGHLRVGEAMKQGQATIPVTYVDLDEDEEAKALAAFDAIGALATHDKDLLKTVLAGIDTHDAGLQALFEEMAASAGPPLEPEAKGLTDDDAVPLARDEIVSGEGDLWLLGDHRLYCGDGTLHDSLQALLEGERADLVWTDPPYNVDMEALNAFKDKGDGGNRSRTGGLANDKLSDDDFRKFLRDLFKAALDHTKPGGCIYIAHADVEGLNFRLAMAEAGWLFKQNLVWVKSSATLSRQDYNWRHEPILYGWKPGAAHWYCQDFKQTTVIDDSGDLKTLSRAQLEALAAQLLDQVATSVIYDDRPARADLHPTMKPVRLVQRLVTNSSKRGQVVLDSCGGSGTTLIACAKVARRARLIEKDPRFADVIVRRWQDWTGQSAIHAESGLTFDEMLLQRGKVAPKPRSKKKPKG